jgi:hypothetical protein
MKEMQCAACVDTAHSDSKLSEGSIAGTKGSIILGNLARLGSESLLVERTPKYDMVHSLVVGRKKSHYMPTVETLSIRAFPGTAYMALTDK